MKPFCSLIFGGSLLLAGFAVPVSPARADVEFSTIANPGSNFLVGGYSILGASALSSFPESQSEADAFTASFTGELTSIRFGVMSDSATAFEVNLYANSSNALPLVSTQVALGSLPVSNETPALETLTIAVPVLLTINTTYWVELAPATPTTNGTWAAAGDTLAAIAISHDGSQTFASAQGSSGAFEINATPLAVPEPSTWVLLGVGVVGAGVVALRRRRASTSK